jgi:membrane fusion protein (multidrug efflux system)
MNGQSYSLTSQPRFRLAVALAVLLVASGGVWLWVAAGRESTDDAQIDAHVTPVSARVGGTVLRVLVKDNQLVDAGTMLVEIDKRDYEIAVDKARAELDDAEASAKAASSSVPVTSTAAESNVVTAQGAIEHAQASVAEADKSLEAARARLAVMQGRLREVEAGAARSARDVERLRGLLAKDEVSQQQFDTASASADGQRATVDAAKAQVAEAEAGILVAESRQRQARASEQQAQAALRAARTAPEQISAAQARAASAAAHVQQARATLAQAELNLEHATVKAPVKGVVSRKSVEPGQTVQSGQPLMALIPLEDVWITANFKETQLGDMRPGQRVSVKVDAYGGRQFAGHVDSIAAATGARFSLLPAENASGNYVKVVQRVPVKIVLDPGQDPDHLLKPGLSVVPTVYTR